MASLNYFSAVLLVVLLSGSALDIVPPRGPTAHTQGWFHYVRGVTCQSSEVVTQQSSEVVTQQSS